MMAKVVNVKVACIRPEYNNLKEWMEDPQNVYIGRAGVVFVDGQRWPPTESPFANPAKIDTTKDQTTERERVLTEYRQHLDILLVRKPELVEVLKGMNGKNLGCWCAPEPCHGDILKEKIASLLGLPSGNTQVARGDPQSNDKNRESTEDQATEAVANTGLANTLKPIFERLSVKNIRVIDGVVYALVPSIEGNNEEYKFYKIPETDMVIYSRGENTRTFKISEIDRLSHYLAPIYKRTDQKSSIFSEIPANDIMVRLHLLFPGDGFMSTSRVVFIGAGTQKSMDLYMAR